MVFTKRCLRTYTRRAAPSSQQFDGLVFQENAFDFKRNDTSSPFTSMHVTGQQDGSLSDKKERPQVGEREIETNEDPQETKLPRKRGSEAKVGNEKRQRKYSRRAKPKIKSRKDSSTLEKLKKRKPKQKASVPAFEMPEMFADIDDENASPGPDFTEPEIEMKDIAEEMPTLKRKSTREKIGLPDQEIALKDKVSAWMAQSSSPQSADPIESADPDSADSSIEIMRGEKLSSCIETRNKLFTDEFYNNIHKVLSPLPQAFHPSKTNRAKQSPELQPSAAIEPTEGGTLSDLTGGLTSLPLTSHRVTGTGLTSEYTTGSQFVTGTGTESVTGTGSGLITGTGTDITYGTDDGVYEIHTQLSPIPDEPEQPEMFKIPTVASFDEPAEPKVAKFMSSTMKGVGDIPYEFPDMSTIPLTASIMQRKITEKTPQRRTSFATPKSPSKSQKVSANRKDRAAPKTSTRLFQTECHDVDSTPQLSAIQKNTGADPHFFKSSLSNTDKSFEEVYTRFTDLRKVIFTVANISKDYNCFIIWHMRTRKETDAVCEDIDVEDDITVEDQHKVKNSSARNNQHAPITTSTPNKGEPQNGDMHFEMDISSVSIGSIDGPLQFHHSTREVNSAEILHLSNTLIDIQEGQVDGIAAKIQKPAAATPRSQLDKDKLISSLNLARKCPQETVKFEKSSKRRTATKSKKGGAGKEPDIKPTKKSKANNRRGSMSKTKVQNQRSRLKHTVSRNKIKKAKLKVSQLLNRRPLVRSSTPRDAMPNMQDLVCNLFNAVTPIEKDSLRVAEYGRCDDGTMCYSQNTIPIATISNGSASAVSMAKVCDTRGNSSKSCIKYVTSGKIKRAINVSNGHKSGPIAGSSLQEDNELGCETVCHKVSSRKVRSLTALGSRFRIKCTMPDSVMHRTGSEINVETDSGFRVRNGNYDSALTNAGDNIAVAPDSCGICTLMNEKWSCERNATIKLLQYIDQRHGGRSSLENIPVDDLL